MPSACGGRRTQADHRRLGILDHRRKVQRHPRSENTAQGRAAPGFLSLLRGKTLHLRTGTRPRAFRRRSPSIKSSTALDAENGKFSAALLGIIESPAFQRQRKPLALIDREAPSLPTTPPSAGTRPFQPTNRSHETPPFSQRCRHLCRPAKLSPLSPPNLRRRPSPAGSLATTPSGAPASHGLRLLSQRCHSQGVAALNGEGRGLPAGQRPWRRSNPLRDKIQVVAWFGL